MTEQDRVEYFISELAKVERKLALHTMTMVRNEADAEDILQETNVVIWNKFHQFETGTNFVAWSFQIANFEVLKFRDKKRSSKLMFAGDVLDVIAQESEEQEDDLDLRRAALQECLKKLRPKDRELIQNRYKPGNTGQSVAVEMGRPINSVYQSIGRIRKILFECINRRLAAGAAQ